MSEGFVVESVFELADRVTPKLLEISRTVERLNAQMDALAEKFSLSGRGNRIVSITNKIHGMNAALDSTVGRAGAAAAALDAMSVRGARAWGVFGGGGRRGGGHGGGESAMPEMHGYVPVGPLHARISGHAGLAGAAALGYGVYENARLDDAITRILLTSQVPVTKDTRYSAQYAALKNIIQSTALNTGAPISTVEEGALNVVRMMAGFKLSERESVLKRVLSFSALEHYLKPSVSMDEASTAMVGLMHMSGTYKPKQINELAKTMMGISLVTPLNMTQIERAASYAVPVLRAGMGIDPTQVMGLMAMMQRSGVINTKSGTWARSFFSGLIPGTLGSGLFKTTNQSKALLALGLINAQGKSTILNSHGKIDLMKAIDTMRVHLDTIPQVYRIKELQQAFGTRGGNFASMMMTGQFAQQWPEIKKFINSLQQENQLLSQLYTGSEVQKARVARESLTVALMNLTTAVMGPLSGSLDKLNGGLKDVISWEAKHSTSAGILGDITLAGIGGLAAKKLGVFGLPAKLWRLGVAVSELAVEFAPLIAKASLLGTIIDSIYETWHEIHTGKTGVIAKTANLAAAALTGHYTEKDFTIGGWLYDVRHPDEPFSGHPKQSINVHAYTYLDGRKIAETVSHHVGHMASGPISGPSGLNGSTGLMPPNLTRGW